MKKVLSGFVLIEILIVLGIISSLSVLSFLGIAGASTKVKNSAKKRDVNIIAQVYEANFDDNNLLYRPLAADDFNAFVVPIADDGTLYSGMLSDFASAFRVCAVLNGRSPTSCNEPSDDCYCLASQKGVYIATDPGSESPTPTGGGSGVTTEPTPTTSSSCTIASASWGVNNAVENDPVSLLVVGSGICEGESVTFAVFEEDDVSEGGLDDSANINPVSTVFASDNSALTTWFAEFENDCLGLCLPPEYYYNASVGASSPTRSSNPLLTVSQSGGGTPTPIPSDTPVPTSLPTDTPIPTPTPLAKRVFATANLYNGNLGGLAGADTKCQDSANAASLGGTWKAWLSTTITSAVSRLSHSSDPYKLVDGTIIANNWTDLTDGILTNSISKDELGNVVGGNVWTMTQTNGTAVGQQCSNWTSEASSILGRQGIVTYTTSLWTNSANVACNLTKHLYCFEQ